MSENLKTPRPVAAPATAAQALRPAVAARTHPVLGLQHAVGNRAVQRLIDEGRKEEGTRETDASFEARLAQRRGAGSPLLESARAFLEPRMGVDLGAVRVHAGGEAHELAGAVNATAFASGNDLYFRDGAYDPHSQEGLRLLAHEVTHVLQQSAGPVAGTAVDGGVSLSDPSDNFEREADRVADEVMGMEHEAAALQPGASAGAGAGGSAGAADAGGNVAVQREEDDDGWFGGLGSLVESAGSALASGAGSVWDAGSDAVSDVGSAVAGGAGSIWDAGSSAVSGVGSAVASGAGALWDAGSGAVSGVGSAVASGAESLWDAGSDAVWDAGSTIASGAGSLWDAGSSAVSDAGSAIASGAGSLWDAGSDAVSDAGSAIASGAGSLWDAGSSAVSGVYEGMKSNAGLVKEGEHWLEHGIDWLEDKAKGTTHWLASQAEGIPVLEQLAGAGESVANTAIDVQGGIWKGVTGMAGGLLGAAANPVDTARGLATMAEHIPGIGMPQKILHGAYDMAFSDKSLGDIANQTFNPKADSDYWGNVVGALADPYKKAIAAGKPGEALGRGVVDIGALFLGAGEAGAAAKMGEVGDLAKAADLADAAKVADVADAAKVADVADAAKVADVSDAAKVADTADAAKASEAADAAKGLAPSAASDLTGMRVNNIGKPTGELAGLTEAEIDAFIGGMDSSVTPLGDRLSLVPYRDASQARAMLLEEAQKLEAMGQLESKGSPVMKALLNEQPVEAMHVLPQSVGESVAGYNGKNALTMLEEKPIHRMADKDWIKEFKGVAEADETTTALDVQKTIGESFQQSAQSQGVKNSLKYRLEDEMAELGIHPGEEIRPYRPRAQQELPPGIEELNFDKGVPSSSPFEEFLEPFEKAPGAISEVEDALIEWIDHQRGRH